MMVYNADAGENRRDDWGSSMDDLDVRCPFCDGEDLRPLYNGLRLKCTRCGCQALTEMWLALAERQAEEER
jgi:hypothetical protein